MNHIIEQFLHRGLHVSIGLDDDASSPRTDNENTGRMVCSHRNYTLGDDARTLGFTFDSRRFDGWADVERWLKDEQGAVVTLPLFLHDHGTLHLSVGGGDSWDSGQVGVAYMTHEAIEKNWSDLSSDERIKAALRCLEAEIREYDDYLSGKVYGYLVQNHRGEVLESCRGFIGDLDYVYERARDAAEYVAPGEEQVRATMQARIDMAREFVASHATQGHINVETINAALDLLARREGVK